MTNNRDMETIRELHRRVYGGIFSQIRPERQTLKDKLLREIWQKYHPKLQVFLASDPFCSPGEREDRASEILLRVFESLESYDSKYAFSTWLYRIARNSQIDLYRKKSLPMADWDLEGDIVPEGARERETPESIFLADAEKAMVKRMIEELKPADRRLLFLAFYEEMSYGEISRIIGRPVGTIKYEIHRIKKIMKEKIKEVSA